MASLVSQSRVAIAQLNPNLESVDHSSVHGIVTLVWPYNSFTQSLGLLLVEPDFRLRRHQGQVRIQFLGSAAKAVSKAGVSSGDDLALSLQGASWEKDNETANTPGRSIAWKVTFGERVVLETRSQGQAPKIVDIDHPPLSPQPSRQASSPPSSPIYNSHIPTSSRKQDIRSLNDDYSTWSSPAFLKRSHFALSSYDPFTELDDDFADNDRKKKKKFGRGSGQWKFVGNEPSPEREQLGDLPTQESSVSPSKPMQHVDKRMAILAPSPVEIHASANGDTRAAIGGIEPSRGNGEVTSDLSNEREIDRGPLTVVADTNFSDRPSLDHKGEHPILELNAGQTHGGSPKESDDQKTIDSSSAKPLSSQTSPSVVSVRDHSFTLNSESSENNGSARDSQGDAIRNESESGLGMDGSAMSKVQQAVDLTPMANEIGRRWIEMQSRANKAETKRPASRESGSMSSLQLRNEPSVEKLNVSGETSDKSEVSGQSGPGFTMPAMSRSLEDSQTFQDPSSRMEDNDEIVSLEQSGKDETDKRSLVQTLQQGDTQWAEKGHDSHSTTSTSHNDRFELGSPSVSSKDKPAITDQNRSQHGQLLRALSQQPASLDLGLTQTSPASTVADVDMGGDDRLIRREDDMKSAEDVGEHQLTNVPSDRSNTPVRDINSINDQNVLAPKDSLLDEGDYSIENRQNENVDVESAEETAALAGPFLTKNSLSEKKGDLSSGNGPETKADQLIVKADFGRTSNEFVSDFKSNSDIAKPHILSDSILQDLTTEAGQFPFELGIPSTIPDTFENHGVNELVAVDNSQQMREFFSQRSTSPIHSRLEDEKVSIPSPVREINDSISASGQNLSDMADVESNKSQASDVLASEESASRHDVPEEIANVPGPVTFDEVPKVDSEVTAPDHTSGRKPLAQLSEQLSEPKQVKGGKDNSSGLSLITRLKELRRQSDIAGLERQSSSSANPWFAPRRPSLATNSEVDINVGSEPSEQVKVLTAERPTNYIPENLDLALAKSFAGSSPPRSVQPLSPSTLTQESQYIPNSQQTAGFRTNLSYFVPVASLHCHYGTSVDILAVAISSTPVTRAPSGPRDHTQSIHFTDPSSTVSKSPTSLTMAQIFRPYRTKKESLECFPSLQPGDAILLRDFKVQSFQKSLSLISTDSSAWAVFRKDAEVSIPGPPVEYGPEERAFARGLWDWWSSLEPAHSAALIAAVPKPKYQTGVAKKAPAKKGLGFDLPSSQSQSAAKKSESSDNSIPIAPREPSANLNNAPDADIDEDDNVNGNNSTPPRRVLRPRKAKGMANASPEKDTKPKVEEIHELRDGTRYVDREGVGVEEVEMVNGVHDLRDGTRYRDRPRK